MCDMKIVADTSIIIAILLGESGKERILQLTSEAEVFCSTSLDAEIGNAFSSLMKQKKLTLHQAKEALSHYQKMQFNSVPFHLENSVKISSELNIYAYDAYLIDVAERLNTPLLTLDKKLKAAAEYYGIKTIGLHP